MARDLPVTKIATSCVPWKSIVGIPDTTSMACFDWLAAAVFCLKWNLPAAWMPALEFPRPERTAVLMSRSEVAAGRHDFDRHSETLKILIAEYPLRMSMDEPRWRAIEIWEEGKLRR